MSPVAADGTVTTADGRVVAVIVNPEDIPQAKLRVHRRYCECRGQMTCEQKARAS